MRLPEQAGHLTYCTNIHRGESWADLCGLLAADLPAVKRAVCPDAPFGVGLRLSARAVAEAGRPAALERLKGLLAEAGLYVFTLNAFPYGLFHGGRVKESVYLPDWQAPERLAYTDAAADLLAALLPEGLTGSVSTVPGAFGTAVTGPEGLERIAEGMIRHVAHLVCLERRTGRHLALAIEPEPSCLVETTDDAVRFFAKRLFSGAAAARLAALTGSTAAAAETALRRHLGLCLDLCHAAVEFEEPGEVFAKLRSSGLPVHKMQISAGLRLEPVGPSAPALLAPLDDGVYLHQVVARRGTHLTRYPDLDLALAALDSKAPPDEWRVHYHVPLFLDAFGPLRSTQEFVRDALALHRTRPISDHLEVETYTWEVLPEPYRAMGLVPAIARELEWVRRQLVA